jgi:hypothetical protein
MTMARTGALKKGWITLRLYGSIPSRATANNSSDVKNTKLWKLHISPITIQHPHAT